MTELLSFLVVYLVIGIAVTAVTANDGKSFTPGEVVALSLFWIAIIGYAVWLAIKGDRGGPSL